MIGTSRDLAWPDLIWSHFSRPRFGEFDQRAAAAAAAGFAAIGLYAYDYRRMRDEEARSPAELRDVLAMNEMLLAEIEIVRGWWATSGSAHEECVEMEALAFEMADEFGVRYLQVIAGNDCSTDDYVTGFGELCDRAADHGLLVGIEWLPFTDVRSAADAQRIVEAADRPNGGYCVDIWHHARGANDIEMIRALGGDRVFAIQMNDGTLQQTNELDYRSDCLVSRVVPGAGEFDCVGLIRTLHEMGVTSPISLEVCSNELWAAPVATAAQRAADGMRQVLATAPSGLGSL